MEYKEYYSEYNEPKRGNAKEKIIICIRKHDVT